MCYRAGNPATIDRILAAHEFDVGGLPGVVGILSPLEGVHDSCRVGNPLSVQTQFSRDAGHINIFGPHDLMGEWVVSLTPEARAIPGEPAIADVHHRDANLLSHWHF